MSSSQVDLLTITGKALRICMQSVENSSKLTVFSTEKYSIFLF